MAWEHLSVTKAHLVYIILGGFTSLFMLCSSIIKERMYIGEATVATLCGVIFGPHAANLINPRSWGNVDLVTLEFSRIVLVVQCFAVGVELPKYYMERHWKSVVLLLLPVMTFGWLIVSLVVWWMVPPLDWLESLVVAACVTATDPVLASSVVGKGKFAKRIPKHLRDLLSAESGCNDGMAFPFVYLGIYLIQEHMDAGKTIFHWTVYTILYECLVGAIFGFIIGYVARHAIKFAEKHDLIDRESFLVFYFVLALFCAGSGSMLGMDDLLIGFSAGVGFSNDGWFHAKTEESHVSNVIDLLLNLAYFVFLGTIIPWGQFNNAAEGLTAWRLVVLAIFVLLFRRIPIMLALKPVIPDIKTWREALFAGHFGPIGVGAIFIAILARAELAYETAVPLSDNPPRDTPHYTLVALIWPIVTFLVISSIIVHGSSIAVFTLGKRINTLNLTMSYTTSPDDGPSWINRLPRISSQSRSQAKTTPGTSQEDLKMPEFPPGTLPPVGLPGQFLRRQKDSETPRRSVRSSSRRRDDEVGPGGPISQSAIFPASRASSRPRGETEPDFSSSPQTVVDNGSETVVEKSVRDSTPPTPQKSPRLQVYDEGGNIIVENEEGDVLDLERAPSNRGGGDKMLPLFATDSSGVTSERGSRWLSLRSAFGSAYNQEKEKRKPPSIEEKKHEPARAFQFANTIVIEDEAGEVIKTYELPVQKPENQRPDFLQQCQRYLGLGSFSGKVPVQGSSDAGPSNTAQHEFGRLKNDSGVSGPREQTEMVEKPGEKQIRFTIGDTGKRMTKDDFIQEMQKLDRKPLRGVVDQPLASPTVKSPGNQDPSTSSVWGSRADAQAPSQRYGRPETPPRRTKVVEETGESSSENSTGYEPKDSPLVPKTPPQPARDLDDNDQEETPVEKRRREAALGIKPSRVDERESFREGSPQAPQVRRGIRFAEDLEQRGG